MNQMIKSILMAATLAAALVLNQSCSRGATNDANKQTIPPAESPRTELPLWLLDEANVQADKDTNGWCGVLYFSNQPWHSGERPPMCGTSIKNITTNTLSCWIGFYGETYSRIELLDSRGQPVEKTTMGKQIGTRASTAQIREMVKTRFQQTNRGRARTDGFIRLPPGRTCGIAFSIPDLFHIQQPGQYMMKVQTCLIQRIGGEEYDPELKIIWLPPATAKFQLREKEVNH